MSHAGKKKLIICEWAECGAAFARSDVLRKHRRIHTGERPYKCDMPGCPAAFTQSAHLNKHRRTHTGQKPYKCDWAECSSAFSSSGGLKRHRSKVHENAAASGGGEVKHNAITTFWKRPYKCEDCGAAFTQSGHLLTHRRTHTGEKPYKCKSVGCAAAFARSDTLARHFRTMHTPTPTTLPPKSSSRVTPSNAKRRKLADDASLASDSSPPAAPQQAALPRDVKEENTTFVPSSVTDTFHQLQQDTRKLLVKSELAKSYDGLAKNSKMNQMQYGVLLLPALPAVVKLKRNTSALSKY